MSKNHAIKERQVNTVQHYLEREFPGQVRDTQWDRHRDMQVFEVVPPQLSQTSRPEASGARKPLRLQLAHPQRYVQTAHFRATPSCEPLRRAAAAC